MFLLSQASLILLFSLFYLTLSTVMKKKPYRKKMFVNMHKHVIAAAVLKQMPRKYKQLGITFRQRRSYKKIALATLISCWDLLRFILLIFSFRWTNFDKLTIAPQGVVQVKDDYAYVKKYENLLNWSSTLVVIRSTRGVEAKRARNLYDFTCVYVLTYLISFITSHLSCKKHHTCKPNILPYTHF